MTKESAFDAGDFDASEFDTTQDSTARKNISANVAADAMVIGRDIFVSSRIRMARNIADFPFFDACSDEQRGQIESAVRSTMLTGDLLSQVSVVDCQQLELLEHHFLMDLQAVIGLSPMVAASQNSLLLNGEDHLKIQVMTFDSDLQNAWAIADRIDDAIEQDLNFAFHQQWGYLTACPANVGTGLRASAVLHLPALIQTGKIHEILKQWGRLNIVGREVFGDPTGSDFYRFSNQATLGFQEAELIEQVSCAIPSVVAAEGQARQSLLTADRGELQRESNSALDALQALDLSDRGFAMQPERNLFELIRQLSRVRMGLEMNLLSDRQTAPVAAQFETIQLRERLRTAVAQEEYGLASRLRDRIQILSGGSA